MGTDKALLEIDGVAMARRVADALVAAGADPVLAVGGDGPALARLGLTVVPDEHPGAGPLGGILTALAATRTPILLTVACDLLAPSPDAMVATVAALAARPEAVAAVPVVDGRSQWVHAAWRDSAETPLRAAWHEGARAVHEAAAGLPSVPVAVIDPATLADADAPCDLPRTHGGASSPQ